MKTSTLLNLALSFAGLSSAATSGTIKLLTYNVAGLPDALSSSDPAENTPYISTRISPFSLIAVQEDFNYHAALYASDAHPYRTPTSGGAGIGSGLNILSNYPYIDLIRTTWSDCNLNSGDCLTPKGFLFTRTLIDSIWVDVYTLHTDAGSDSGDLSARAKNVAQLLSAIAAQSAGMPVIVLGDTNMRYTTSGDSARALAAVGTDPWVSLTRSGSVPALGSTALTCAFPFSATASQAEMVACETVDKLFIRGSAAASLTPTAFANEHRAFVHPTTGVPLSDHYPLSTTVSWAVGSNWQLSVENLGGPHSDFYNDLSALTASGVTAGRVESVRVRGGERVDGISVTVAGVGTMTHGGTGGTETSLTLASGETVTGVYACTGQKDSNTRIFYVRLTTSAGRTLATGATTGDCATYASPGTGWVVKGFWGRNGDEVDRLGVVWGKA